MNTSPKVLPIYRVCDKPEVFHHVINSSVATVTVLYSVFGVFGYVRVSCWRSVASPVWRRYLFFGAATNSVITLNLPKNLAVTIVKSGLCVVLTFTFPIQVSPVRVAHGVYIMHVVVQLFPVTCLLEEQVLASRVGKKTYWIEQNLVRTLLVLGD